MAKKTLWEAHLSLLQQDEGTSLQNRMNRAQTIEIFGIIIIIAALVVTIVAFAMNIQGSGVWLYLAIIIVLLVLGVIIVLMAMSMAGRTSKFAKDSAMAQHPEFFRPDGEFTEEGLAYLRS
jgi:Na+-translocating ferredoxin:NAD+ oxidoreductase RnfE subunit